MKKTTLFLLTTILLTACSGEKKLSERDKANIELLNSLSKTCVYAREYKKLNMYNERSFLIILQQCIQK